MKRNLSILLLVLLVFTLVGCSGSANNNENNENDQEGNKLIIYSPNPEPLIEVAYTFGDKYGINVQIKNAGTGDCLDNIAAEKENPQADVMYGGMHYANSINPQIASLFEPYTAAGDDKLPEPYQNLNGITTHYCLDGSAALLINVEEYAKTGLNIDEFDSYADLLAPELKGKIAVGDPAKSSSAWAELTNILLVMGDEPYDEKAWEWINELIRNLDGTELPSSSAIYKGVDDGEYTVGVSYEGPCVNLLIKQADSGKENVRLVYPAEGAVWLPAGAAIIKNAPNMDNAKLFLDWLISDEGQNEIAKTTARPVNPDIPSAVKEMIPLSDINVVYEDMEFCATNKELWLARWAQMFASAQAELKNE